EIQKGLLRATNMREAEEGMVWGIKLEPVVLGNDEDGEPITTRVVEIVKREEVQHGLTGKEESYFTAVKDNAEEEVPFTPTQVKDWINTALNIDLSLGRVSQLLTKFSENGRVRKDEHGQWLIEHI